MGTNTGIDILGWIGALLVILAYFMVSTRRVAGDALAYQLLNIAGGILLIINTVFYGAYPSSGVNLVWVAIGTYSILSRKKFEGSDPTPPLD